MTIYKAMKTALAAIALTTIVSGCNSNYNSGPSQDMINNVLEYTRSRENKEFKFRSDSMSYKISTNLYTNGLPMGGFEITGVDNITGSKFSFIDTCGDGPGVNSVGGSNNYLCGPDIVSFKDPKTGFDITDKFENLNDKDNMFARNLYKLAIYSAFDNVK